MVTRQTTQGKAIGWRIIYFDFLSGEMRFRTSGILLPTPPPYGGRININIPPIPSLPEAPNVAITKLQATLGPQHLTYYEHTHGHTIPYNPKGILLPNTCPPRRLPIHRPPQLRKRHPHQRQHPRTLPLRPQTALARPEKRQEEEPASHLSLSAARDGPAGTAVRPPGPER